MAVDRKHFEWTGKKENIKLKAEVLVCITYERAQTAGKLYTRGIFFLLAMSAFSYVLFFEYQLNHREEFRYWLTFQRV